MVALSVVVAGTIGTYADLKNKVALYLDRDDLDEQISDFVALVEARINRVVRSVNQETRTIWTVSSESYTLPSDFRRLRKIAIEGTPDRPLREISPQSVAGQYNGSTGEPQAYYLEGRTITFAPPPAKPTRFSVTYWARVEPLTSENDSNWLLEEHPDIYLFGSLLEAAVYIRDVDAITYCSGKLDQAIAELQTESRTDRWGAGPLAPRGPSQVRGAPC
jgi:hypothetical protein